MDRIKKIIFATIVFLIVFTVFYVFLKKGLLYFVGSLIFGGALFVFLGTDPLRTVLFFVVLLPYYGIEIFQYHLMDMPGAKLWHLIGVGVFFISLLNFKRIKNFPIFIFLYSLLVILIMTINVYRTLPDVGKVGAFIVQGMTKEKLILTFFVRPLVNFLPFCMMPLFVDDKKDFKTVVNYLFATFIMFASVLFFFWLFFVDNKTDMNSLRDSVVSVFSCLANHLIKILIYGMPILISHYFVTKKRFILYFIALSYILVFLFFSRTAYLLSIFLGFYYLYISGRKNYIKKFTILIILVVVLLPGFIIQRAETGFEKGTINAISAGRVDSIWMPILQEYLEDPYLIWFGNGMFSFVRSKAMRSGLTFEVASAHNMYINLWLDCGILGLFLVLSFLFYIMNRIRVSLKTINDPICREYQYGFYVSLICFFLNGLVSHNILPTPQNSIIWVILAAASVNISVNRSLTD